MFRIREATPADNDALLGLESQSPQGTGISILIDRDDYFYRSRLHDRAKVMIAEEGDKLVGIMAFAIKDVYLDGEKDRAAYFFDLRGEATYRRSMKRGLFRLWKAVLEEMDAADAAFIYGHVKADNNDSMNVSTKMGARAAATFDILSLPTLPGQAVPLDDHLDRLDDEVARLRETVETRNLLPVVFDDAYKRGAELGYLRGIYRIERNGSAAQLSVWDLSKIYRGRVLHMPMSLRLLGGVLNPLAKALPVPRIPRVGESMAYMTLFDPVCTGPQGTRLLKELIQRIRRNAYHEGIDILTYFAYCDDPNARHPRFVPEKVLHYNTMMRPIRDSELPTPPFYLDIRDI